MIPGGVNSPVRAFKAVGGSPRFIASAKGATITDVDGRTYIDYVMSWGPLIHGHAPPALIAQLAKVARLGTSYGAPTELEVQIAEKVRSLVPSIEMVRFTSSGTEATMSAVRVARAATGRDRVIKFAGCYHGHADGFLVEAGSGALTLGVPTSPGVAASTAALTLTATFNDLDSVAALFEANTAQVAAVVVEPIVGNMGTVPPAAGFLDGLRTLCDQHGALLIFDEVMTGFRVHRGGAQALYGVRPDLTCLGKIIGGGLPVGAYGGRKDLMSLVAPAGPMYQAGTLSGNPLAVTAGLWSISGLNATLYRTLDRLTKRLGDGLLDAAKGAGVPLQVNRVGSMITPFFTAYPVTDYASATKSDTERFGRFHRAMLAQGVYLPASQYRGVVPVGGAHRAPRRSHDRGGARRHSPSSADPAACPGLVPAAYNRWHGRLRHRPPSRRCRGTIDGIAAVYLFGSVAAGTDTAASDVDRRHPVRVGTRGDSGRGPSRSRGRPRASAEATGPSRRAQRRSGRLADSGAACQGLLIDRNRAARICFEVATRNEFFDLEPMLRDYRAPRGGPAVTDPALVAKKLAAIETAFADLRRLAQPDRLSTDLLQRRCSSNTLCRSPSRRRWTWHRTSCRTIGSASRGRTARCSRCSRKPAGSTRRSSTACRGWWAFATSWSTATTTWISMSSVTSLATAWAISRRSSPLFADARRRRGPSRVHRHDAHWRLRARS